MDFLKQNLKLIIFILIITTVTILYNQNSQDLNHFLKRGVILEYSINKNTNPNINLIIKKLNGMDFKYSSVHVSDIIFDKYDVDNKKVERTLSIALNIMPKTYEAQTFNEISDYIFDNYPETELIDIKTFPNDRYVEYCGLFKILPIVLLSFIFWIIALFLIFGKDEFVSDVKKIYTSIKDGIVKAWGFLKKAFSFLLETYKSMQNVGFFKYICITVENFFEDMLTSITNFLKEIISIPMNFLKETFKDGFIKGVSRCIIGFIKCIIGCIVDVVKEIFLFFLPSLQKKKDKEKKDFLAEMVDTIIFVILAVILIRYFIGELRWIPSGSMIPVIQIKDRVCVEKLDYPIKKEIKRGDILVFYPPSTQLSNDPISAFTRLSGIFNKDIAYIKRTIGLPGEKFEIKYNEDSKEYRVYINDVPLMEPYIISKTIWTQCNENLFCGPFIIPENSYFMMGDNRNNSQDSRFWGMLKRDRIIGRATFMFWPLDRINLLKDNYIKLHKNKYETYTYIVNRYEFLL